MVEKKPQVFLSYAEEDLAQAQRLCEDLTQRGVNVWFSKRNIGPGPSWKKQIDEAIPKSRFFLICLSEVALEKIESRSGYLHEELQQAWEIKREQGEGSFSIVPVRLEDCRRGDRRLTGPQQFDLYLDWEGEVERLAEYFTQRKFIKGLLREAWASYRAGDYSETLKAAEDVIATDADYAEAWRLKGIALGELGESEEALKALKQTLKLRPGYAEAWYSKGIVLDKAGEPKESRKAFKRATRLSPRFAEAWMHLGVTYGNVDLFEPALEAFERLTELQPNSAMAWFNKSTALGKLGRNEEALNAANQAIQLQPDYHEAWINKAASLKELGRLEEAQKALDQAEKLEPHHV